MLAIYKKELRQYFTSPVGYVFVAAFLAISGFLFSMFTVQYAVAGDDYDLGTYYTVMMFVCSIIVPLLTMKTFSEERKLRTEQLLLTAPVGIGSMVAAKFMASYTVFAGTFLISCSNLFILYKYGEPAGGVLLGYTIGILLIGAAFVAIGTFVSSLTENQLTAAIGTIGILMLMLLVNFLNDYIDWTWVRLLTNWFSIYSRFINFTYGIFDYAAILYYASIVVIFLFLTVRIYEKRRWE